MMRKIRCYQSSVRQRRFCGIALELSNLLFSIIVDIRWERHIAHALVITTPLLFQCSSGMVISDKRGLSK